MKTKTNKLNIIILALFIAVNFLLPQNTIQAVGDEVGSDDSIIEQFDPTIQRLKEEIQNYQDQLTELQKQRQTFENSIKAKRQEINNLNNQLGILGDTMAKLVLEIQTIELRIDKTNLEIENTQLEINHKKAEIENQQYKMSDVLRTIYKHERKKSYLEVLILKGDIGNFFKEVNELQVLEQGLSEKLTILAEIKKQLDTKKDNLEKRKEQLINLREKLATNNERLTRDKNVKSQLLNLTRGQEADFQKLLSEVKAEQAEINANIMEMEVQARRRLLETEGVLPSDDGFIWPVASRRITAYFHDPEYPYRYIFEHPAIDIGSTPQGTPLRAARSGYVARVKFDGTTRYAYILIVHTGGLSTVYGHISKPYVREDDFVVQGEVIALSGGTFGTPGVGRLSTGPHLHFEVRLNGIPVDPLKYLP